MTKHSLEQYKVFPYIAWTLIISFSLFTAHLAYSLVNTVKSYEQEIPVINQINL